MSGSHLPLLPNDLRSDTKPIWCPGCGDYGVLAALLRALATLGRDPDEIVLVSGIGCSSRLPAYTTFYGFHGVHGRALPLASGLKLARPDLLVIALGGDGDGYSIGGNHFMHACRRDLDLLYLVMDNRVYGMTKGQPSPTTEPDWESALSASASTSRMLDPLALALVSGASFVARGFSGDPKGLAELIVEAIQWEGFAVIDCLSPCVTFRPEERAWREQTHEAKATKSTVIEALSALNEDDGLGLGVFYKDIHRQAKPKSIPSLTQDELETELCQWGIITP